MDEDVESLLDTIPVQVEHNKRQTSILDYIYVCNMSHLTEEQLAGFSKYKYSSIDTSPLSKYIMHPFWNWGVTFFPLWMAPNVMTMLGYVLLVIDYVLLAYYDWSFTASDEPNTELIPRWVWFVVAFNHFWSHQLDGMDGKQARRTGSGSPLGELMDHGIDSNCMWMLPVMLMSALGSDVETGGIGIQYAPTLLLLMSFNFWIAHWEKYNTGVLYLPWFFDIAQLTVVGVFLLAGFLSTTGLKALFAEHTIPLTTLLFYGIPLGAAASLGLSILNVYSSIKAGTSKQYTDSWSEMLRPWVPYIIMNMLFLSCLVSCNDAFVDHPRIWTIAYGFTFSNVVCRLMVNQMSDTRCALVEPPLIPLAIAWFLAVVLQIYPPGVVAVYTVYAMVAFIQYTYVVVNDLCDHLNICAFSITHKRR